jgi:hypothetical protein
MDENSDLVPLRIIRSETALSRYPLHKLVKTKENFSIEIRRENAFGEVSFRWEVSYNSKYGQPGPLAYKLDSLVINRRIEHARRPIPRAIRLGSLREIAEELGLGGDTSLIKKALHQNASAYITAKFKYTGKDGRERTAEFGKTRYGVIFTGQILEDGSPADAVYIELNDWYRELLNDSQTRPLDYDYLKELPPLAQRLYELLSFQIYAALRNNRPQAKYLYSDFCTYAPATRYDNYEQVKKQMYKIHASHKAAGYIAKVEFQKTEDLHQRPDWWMIYTPGPKAKAEYAAFARRGREAGGELLARAPEASEEHRLAEKRDLPPQEQAWLAQLVAQEIAEATARELLAERPEAVARQLEALPYRDLKSVRDRAAWLISAIKENYSLPERLAQDQQRAIRRQEKKAQQAHAASRQRHESRHQEAYSQYLAQRIEEIKQLHPAAYTTFEEDSRSEREKTLRLLREHPDGSLGQLMVTGMTCEYFREHPECPILEFWAWDMQLNPHPWRPPTAPEMTEPASSRR